MKRWFVDQKTDQGTIRRYYWTEAGAWRARNRGVRRLIKRSTK